jgi:hypothetical protein
LTVTCFVWAVAAGAAFRQYESIRDMISCLSGI